MVDPDKGAICFIKAVQTVNIFGSKLEGADANSNSAWYCSAAEGAKRKARRCYAIALQHALVQTTHETM